MIEIKNLYKSFTVPIHKKTIIGYLKNIIHREYVVVNAIDNISFKICEGEIVGFIGPNGAGKTTTMKMISGILYPTAGTISVSGFNPYLRSFEFLSKISFIMGQRSQFYWELPASDVFELNKRIYKLNNNDFYQTKNALTNLLDCQKLIHRPVKTLSLGERMRVEIIASLLHKPKLLLLDEPTIGLDVVSQKIIRDFLTEYCRRQKATILLTSHNMEDVVSLCKRVIIINQGKILYDGDLQKLIKKFIKTKTIEVIIENIPSKNILEKLIFKPSAQLPKLIFKVPRTKIPQALENITKLVEYTDISIYEEKIEDVVREIFTQGKK